MRPKPVECPATMNLKDLAQKLGLSPTTVSRALNGYPE
ncbi:MAG: helix-turn-helix domain-containing protein, partial [Paracoccaceae bacterium]